MWLKEISVAQLSSILNKKTYNLKNGSQTMSTSVSTNPSKAKKVLLYLSMVVNSSPTCLEYLNYLLWVLGGRHLSIAILRLEWTRCSLQKLNQIWTIYAVNTNLVGCVMKKIYTSNKMYNDNICSPFLVVSCFTHKNS